MLKKIVRRSSLRVIITAVLVTLLLVMAGMTWLLTYRNGHAFIRELEDSLGRVSMQDIRTNLERYLSVPRLVNDMNEYTLSAGSAESLSTGAIARRFAAELTHFDSVISIAYSNENGEYVGMARDAGGVPFSLAIADASTGGHLAAFRSGAAGTQGAEFDRSSGHFDARQRPWYVAAVSAGMPTWTPVYLWLSGDAGVDFVTPVHDHGGAFRGVLDTSLTLSGIGKFLGRVRVTPHANALIVDGSGLLVAASGIRTPYRRAGESLVRFTADDIPDGAVRAGVRRIMAELTAGESLDSERQFFLTVDGARQVMRAARFTWDGGLDWYFAEVIPESDFAQPIYDDMRSTAVFVALFLLASVAVALVLARRISAPLKLLTRTAQGMGNGQLTVQIPVTGTLEVSQLSESFNAMAAELRRSFGSLAESEGRYRAFVTNSSAGIFRFEAREPMPVSLPEEEQVEWFYRSFYLAECNEMAVRMFGADSIDLLLGRGPEVWLPREDPQSAAYLRRMMRSPSPISGDECQRPDSLGAIRTLLTSVSATVESGRVQRLWSVFRDVTEHRAAEDALRRSEARLRSIFHRSAVSLLEADVSELHAALEGLAAGGITDLEGYLRENQRFLGRALHMIRIVDANETAVELLGAASRQELLGPLNVRFEPQALASVVPAAIANVQPGQQYSIETRVTSMAGKSIDVILHLYVPAETDILTNMLISAVDITKRTQAEKEREALQEELRQAQKVETIGRLAGGISHDINNLLTPILGGAELLVDQTDGDPRETAGQVLAAALRIRELTRKLLAFSRKQQLAKEVVSLGSVVADFQKLLRRTLRGNIDMRVFCAEESGLVRVDVGQIEQVLMNLAVNAQDAMPRGGTLSIEVRGTTLDQETAALRGGVQPGGYVALTVTDTGTGMDAATQAHLFEPFFTTKGPGKGTGLGLSTVYGIVRQHEGAILVDSEPGWGTRFTILIPQHAGE
jgi:signal transduction histidine kinase/HAMP domain-containing protein